MVDPMHVESRFPSRLHSVNLRSPVGRQRTTRRCAISPLRIAAIIALMLMLGAVNCARSSLPGNAATVTHTPEETFR